DGTPGTGRTGSGDDWGTWGGYHDWDLDSIVDEADRWEVTAYLIGRSPWVVDNCPYDSLTSDLAIRKPQRFLPEPNTLLNWLVVSLTQGDTLQSGTTTVDAEGWVKVQGITLYNELVDSVRIVFSTGVPTGIEHVGNNTPLRFALHQNYPNPFLGSTTIAYDVERPGSVTLIVYDLLGHAVRTLVGEAQPVGSYQVAWDGRDAGGQPVSSGAYFYRLSVGDAVTSKQAIRVK
ncbi:MAG: FlgD immunoglobulin-like domain containing protein, partial [Dehalococcoidia bacterium]